GCREVWGRAYRDSHTYSHIHTHAHPSSGTTLRKIPRATPRLVLDWDRTWAGELPTGDSTTALQACPPTKTGSTSLLVSTFCSIDAYSNSYTPWGGSAGSGRTLPKRSWDDTWCPGEIARRGPSRDVNP